VVVENFRAVTAHELGLSWEHLKEVNPKLVYCSISGFGQEGEMSRWPAFDHTIQAMAGMIWSGRDDDVPSQGRGFSVDCFTGYVAYASILSGLLRRERTGQGQYLDVAMLDASMVLLAVGSVRQMMTGDSITAAQPIAHDRPTVAPYRTTDGWLWLSANFQNQYEALCRVIDAPDLVSDPRFKDVRSRNAHSAELKAELATRLAGRSAAELERQLMEAGCPAAMVRTTRDVLQLLREREVLIEAQTPGRDEPVTLINAGFTTDAEQPGVRGPVPALAQHTDEVLRELGYGETEIGRLRADGAV
jgi:CoA:oxalate CoA-transferase